MFSTILKFLENIFLIPEQKLGFNKISLDKTAYYKEKFDIFQLDKIYIACEYEQNLQKSLKKFKYEYNKKSLGEITSYYDELIEEFIRDRYDPEDMIIT
jgi:hypothetical protein